VGVFAGPDLSENGLVLYLDAANTKSILSAVEVLVVAGGGGGGTGSYNGGGGGGGGGFREATAFSITPGSAITVIVGDGGSINSNGGSSVFSTITSAGGGAGGGFNGASLVGSNGGSGGGGGAPAGTGISFGGTGNTPSTSPPQGNSGGAGEHISGIHAAFGGGGGAGGIGGDFVLTPGSGIRRSDGGFGGAGSSSSISGTSVTYAGGGGGGGHTNQGGIGGIGGVGGGGSGSGPSNAVAGTPNTGGGGGGQGHSSGAAAAGGSGIVIVRYPGSQRATGGTVTSVGGYTIHTFTTSGTFTPTWGDLTLNGNTGTLTNGPTYNSANGGSIVFDGVDDGVNIPHNSNIDIRNQITIECLFYLNSFTAGGPNADRITLITKVYSYYMTINLSGKIDTYFYGTGGYFSSNSSVNLNQWTHVVVTFNGSTINWYINGIIDKSLSQSGTITPVSNGDLGIGREVFEDYGRGMNGRISNAKLYNRALTATEVSQNFNALRGRYGL